MTLKNISKAFAALLFFLVLSVSASYAAETQQDRTVLTVGGMSFSEGEIVRLLMESSGGNEIMAAMLLAQSSLDDRQEILDQVADAALFAEAAKGEGLDLNAEVAFQIKWQTMQILAQAYFDKAAQTWDYSAEAVRRYYDAHKAEFVQREAVKAAHILTETESDAIMAQLEAHSDFAATAQKYSRDPNTARNGGDLGWVEKGQLVAPVEQAVMAGAPGQIVGPVQSEFGWHVIQVGGRRQNRQLTYEEAEQQAIQSLHTSCIERELEKLRKKYSVIIDVDVLRTMGGFAAPDATQ